MDVETITAAAAVAVALAVAYLYVFVSAGHKNKVAAVKRLFQFSALF